MMYRPNMLTTTNPSTPDGLIRASELTIRTEGDALLVEEVQDFPQSEYGRKYFQRNSGVMFPYGVYVFFLMRGERVDDNVETSFKACVIDLVETHKTTAIEYFYGTIFVASSLKIFPTVRCYCVRNHGDLRPGLMPLASVADGEARAGLGSELARMLPGRRIANGNLAKKKK
jgi:hypothetical protein